MGVTPTPEAVNATKIPSQAAPQHELTVLATVAHELRGPLTAIATSSELLAEDFPHLDPAQIKSMLGAMHRRTLWLQGLVENLLAAATIREGRLQLYRQSLSVRDLLADVDAVVRPLLVQRGQQVWCAEHVDRHQHLCSQWHRPCIRCRSWPGRLARASREVIRTVLPRPGNGWQR
jgi:K+-sensing histidine kinase KdpD